MVLKGTTILVKNIRFKIRSFDPKSKLPQSRTMYKCLDCKVTLVKHFENGQVSHICQSCRSQYMSISSFKKFLSDFEFNKLNHEVKNGRIISSLDCPGCSSRMVKILDLVRVNHVEACKKCQMVWLDPGESAKIILDQKNEDPKNRKVKLDLGIEIHPVGYANENTVSLQGHIQAKIFNGLIKFFHLEELSKINPVLSFAIMILIFIVTTIGSYFILKYMPGIHYVYNIYSQ